MYIYIERERERQREREGERGKESDQKNTPNNGRGLRAWPLRNSQAATARNEATPTRSFWRSSPAARRAFP